MRCTAVTFASTATSHSAQTSSGMTINPMTVITTRSGRCRRPPSASKPSDCARART